MSLPVQVVDLRWGVRGVHGDHEDCEIFLEEIRKCRQTSAGPSFIVSFWFVFAGHVIKKTSCFFKVRVQISPQTFYQVSLQFWCLKLMISCRWRCCCSPAPLSLLMIHLEPTGSPPKSEITHPIDFRPSEPDQKVSEVWHQPSVVSTDEETRCDACYIRGWADLRRTRRMVLTQPHCNVLSESHDHLQEKISYFTVASSYRWHSILLSTSFLWPMTTFPGTSQQKIHLVRYIRSSRVWHQLLMETWRQHLSEMDRNHLKNLQVNLSLLGLVC